MKRSLLLTLIAFITALAITYVFYLITQPQFTYILVAKNDLSSGTKLTPASVKWQRWSQANILPQHIEKSRARLESVFQTKLRVAVKKDQPISKFMLGSSIPRRFNGILEAGTHAMVLPIGQALAASGFLAPGDRVDLMLTRKVQSGDGKDNYVSEIILHNILVLAVGRSFVAKDDSGRARVVSPTQRQSQQRNDNIIQRLGGGSSRGAVRQIPTISVGVTTKQAEIIRLAQKMGDVTTLLSSDEDTQHVLKNSPRTFSRDLGYQAEQAKREVSVLRGTNEKTVDMQK